MGRGFYAKIKIPPLKRKSERFKGGIKTTERAFDAIYQVSMKMTCIKNRAQKKLSTTATGDYKAPIPSNPKPKSQKKVIIFFLIS